MNKEGSSFGTNLSRFIIVISAVGLGLALLIKNLITPKTFVVLLVLAVIAAVINSSWVKLFFALAAIAFTLLIYYDFDISKFSGTAVMVILLILMLFGMYVILGGMRKRK
jgi:hypothetical protein